MKMAGQSKWSCVPDDKVYTYALNPIFPSLGNYKVSQFACHTVIGLTEKLKD